MTTHAIIKNKEKETGGVALRYILAGNSGYASTVFNYFRLRMGAILLPEFHYAIAGDFKSSLCVCPSSLIAQRWNKLRQ